jgi:hypothetical protein
LEKGKIGGFALSRLGEIPPSPPFYKGGNAIYGQLLLILRKGYQKMAAFDYSFKK